MGVVLQENHLFNKSVRDNIAQSMPHASLDQIIRAATLAGAHDFILRLPLGYDTVLAEGAARSPAVSASASPSPAPCWPTPGSSSSTRPPVPSTMSPRR